MMKETRKTAKQRGRASDSQRQTVSTLALAAVGTPPQAAREGAQEREQGSRPSIRNWSRHLVCHCLLVRES